MEWTSSGIEDRKGKLREYVSGKTDAGKWTKRSRVSEFSYKPTAAARTIEKAKSNAKNAAEKWREELNAELEEESKRDKSAIRKSKMPVAEYVAVYIDELEAAKTVEPSTIVGYRGSTKHFPESFRSIAVKELRKEDVRAWVADLQTRGLSSSTVIKSFRILSQAFKEAEDMGAIDKNPATGVRLPKKTNKSKGINALSAGGRDKVLKELDRMHYAPVAVAARISLYTGIREGEVCGLQWGDLDTDHQCLWIRRSIGRGKGGCYSKDPKNDKVRDVVLPDELAEFLGNYRDSLRDRSLPCGELDYMIPNIDSEDGFTQPAYICRHWSTISKSYGFIGREGRPATFHDLRHTWATLAVASGVDIKTVSSNLGHSNAAITLNIYASSDSDAKRRAARLIEQNMLPKAGEVIHLHTGTEG